MAMPNSFRLAARFYAIERSGLPEATDGLHEPDAAVVRVEPSLSPWSSRDTLLHELGHAVLNSQGRPYGGKVEEQYVQALATGFLHLFRENPDLVNYLFKEPL